MAAAIQAHRLGVSVVLIEPDELGGQLRSANLVENYPGFPGGIPGRELADLMARQVHGLGVDVESLTVSSVQPEKEGFELVCHDGDGTVALTSRSVIVTTGAAPCRWDVDIPDDVRDLVHVDAWDPEMFRDRDVVVIGGGEAALDRALYLNRHGARVRVISRSRVRAMKLLKDRVRECSIPMETGCLVEEVSRTDGRLRIRTADGLRFEADHVMVCIGKEPRVAILPEDVRDDLLSTSPDDGFMVGTLFTRTRYPGLLLAGDLVSGDLRHVGCAVGGGLAASLVAVGHINNGREKQ